MALVCHKIGVSGLPPTRGSWLNIVRAPCLVDRAHTGSGAHPFTAPSNRPRTRYFCRTKNMTAMGIMVSNEAPSLRGNWLPEDRPPLTRLARPGGQRVVLG